MKLLLNATVKFLIGFLLIALLLFIPAGDINYLGAWRFIILLFVPVLIVGIVLFIKSPELLKKRIDGKEKEGTQKGVVAFSALIFLSGFIIAGLDYKFAWSYVPDWVVIVASVLFLLSYIIYAEVMRENAYLSRTIGVHEGQKVVDTGLYSFVRHPMYGATVIMFLSIPAILGSWWALVPFAMYPAVIVCRIKNEEKLLLLNLNGYTEYIKKVKYRLIPFIW